MRGARIAIGLVAIAAVAIGWWLADRARDRAPGAADPPALEQAAPASAMPTAAEAQGAGAAPGSAAQASAATSPAHRIREGGRLSVSAAELPGEGTFALALDLQDDARGGEPRPVRIVSADGSRTLELTASALAGPGTGVELAIDPGWLTPDRYLIEVTTAETTHFPLRRYVLEVGP